MKIVLSSLPTEGQFINWAGQKYFLPKEVVYMPLGILSLASNIPPKYDVKILDPASEGWTVEETINNIEKEKPDILGLSALTRRVWALEEILKKTSAPYKVVGGPHATYYAEEILRKKADAVFVGQLADREFAEAIETKPRGIIECTTGINDIHFPKRDFLKIENYFPENAPLFEANKRLPMFSSVGCPRRCTYCNVQSKKGQYKNPATILDEMEYLYSVGARSIHVLDDNFNFNQPHLRGILEEMDKRDFYIEWSGRGQIKMDFSLVPRMVERGFKRIHAGVEALDNKLLKNWNKGQTVKDIEVFCNEMNKNNVDIIGFFILGDPLDTEEYVKNLPRRIKEFGIKYPFFSVLFPEPDTEYYRSLVRDGHYKKDYWAEFMKHPTPYFEIPYPYGEKRKEEVLSYTKEIINEFKHKEDKL
jgi:anaerobic magnesium-protoporphyrin IX monomethyl ester cyclase